MRSGAISRGEDIQTLPRQYAALINAALRDKPTDMTVAIHLCRGNFRSRSFSSGGYEPVAEGQFGFLLPCSSSHYRMTDFKPWSYSSPIERIKRRHVPVGIRRCSIRRLRTPPSFTCRSQSRDLGFGQYEDGNFGEEGRCDQQDQGGE